jgi:hypothetical protein
VVEPAVPSLSPSIVTSVQCPFVNTVHTSVPAVPRPISRLGVLSTLVDAGVAFARGQSVSGVLLLVAAAFSTRVPGLGVAVSLLLRAYRRFR